MFNTLAMPRSRLTAVTVLTLAGLTSACVARTSVQGVSSSAAGGVGPAAELKVDGRALAVAGCRSGDHASFLGADLLGASDEPLLRVVIDPLNGARLRLWAAERGGVVLGPDQCPELRASVRPTGWRVNEIRDVAGQVEARCTLDDGGVLEASVAFDHCH
jgi:hypothetical protein